MRDFEIFSCIRSYSIESGNDKLSVDIELFNTSLSTSAYVVVYNIVESKKRISFKYDDTLDIYKIIETALDFYYKKF